MDGDRPLAKSHWKTTLKPHRILRWFRWSVVHRAKRSIQRSFRLWRLMRFPKMPLDNDLYVLASGVAERIDEILVSIHSSSDPSAREIFRDIEPKVRELADMAFRLVGIAQELRTALARVDKEDPDKVLRLRSELAAARDPDLQNLVAQTLKSEERKTESLALCRRNLRFLEVKLGAITSFLDSMILRVPNVKALADRHDGLATLTFEFDNELKGLEEAFQEFRSSLPVSHVANACLETGEKPALPEALSGKRES